jgi:ZIP family zinc transporter
METVLIAVVVGVVGTGAGGVLVSLWGNPGKKILAVFLGFSGGVMISVVAFDLMPQAFTLAGTYVGLAALLAGALSTMAIDLLLPHVHHFAVDKESSKFERTAIVVAAGIAMHDLPEGLAVGAGLSSATAASLGLKVAVMMFLHNIPEGIAVAGPLAAMGRRWAYVVGISALTGCPSVLGAAIGSLVGRVSPVVLAFSLAFSAGAMLFVTFDELIPGAQELADGHAGTLGAVAGIIASIAMSRLMTP